MSEPASASDLLRLKDSLVTLEAITSEQWVGARLHSAEMGPWQQELFGGRGPLLFGSIVNAPQAFLLQLGRTLLESQSTTSYAAILVRQAVDTFVSAVNGVKFNSGEIQQLSTAWDSVAVRWSGELKDGIARALSTAYLASIEPIASDIKPALERVADAHKAALSALADANSMKLEMAKLLDQAALAKEARSFTAVQRSFAGQANIWFALLVATSFSLVGTLACWISRDTALETPELPWHAAGSLAYFGPRVALVSLLTTFIVVCVQHYRAASHNRVVNLHRATSIITVRALARHGEGQTRDMLLQLVAQSVFAPAATGYSSKDPVIAPQLIRLPDTPTESKV